MNAETGPLTPATAVDWSALRREMPIARNWAYFEHAATAPLAGPAAEAMRECIEDSAGDGGLAWTRQRDRREALRRRAAEFLGADVDEISLVRSTSEGVNIVAEGFPWQAGDNIVTLADEFPSNVYAWLNQGHRGVETRRVPVENCRVDLDRVAAACDGRTRIVSVSWVGYATGWRNDLHALADIAHQHGALLFVDAIQALGALPLDVRQTPIDFLSADGHKWLLGPEGAGLFFIRRQHLDRLHPIGVGWNSVVHASDYGRIELRLRPTAQRFEGGSSNMVGFAGLNAALELLMRFGIEAVGRQVLAITDLCCQRLESAGAKIRTARELEQHKSGIVIFDWPGHDPQLVRKKLIDRRIQLSCRGGGLRISPHAYTTVEEVDQLIEGLKSV